MDWRKQMEGIMEIPPDARGLGAIESNEDKLFANRMKKRGMSWTILGSQKMGKGIQLSYNGEWKPWCGRNKPEPLLEKEFVSFDLFDETYPTSDDVRRNIIYFLRKVKSSCVVRLNNHL